MPTVAGRSTPTRSCSPGARRSAPRSGRGGAGGARARRATRELRSDRRPDGAAGARAGAGGCGRERRRRPTQSAAAPALGRALDRRRLDGADVARPARSRACRRRRGRGPVPVDVASSSCPAGSGSGSAPRHDPLGIRARTGLPSKGTRTKPSGSSLICSEPGSSPVTSVGCSSSQVWSREVVAARDRVVDPALRDGGDGVAGDALGGRRPDDRPEGVEPARPTRCRRRRTRCCGSWSSRPAWSARRRGCRRPRPRRSCW